MKIQFLKDEAQLSDEITIKYSKDSEIIDRLKKYISEINKEYCKIEIKYKKEL